MSQKKVQVIFLINNNNQIQTEFSLNTKLETLRTFLRDSTHFEYFQIIYNNKEIQNHSIRIGQLDKSPKSKYYFHVIDSTKECEAIVSRNLQIATEQLDLVTKEKEKLEEENENLVNRNNEYFKRIEELEELVEKFQNLYEKEKDKNQKLNEQIQVLKDEKNRRNILLNSFNTKGKNLKIVSNK